MPRDKLDDSNFLLYAAKHYDNKQCYDTVEFYEDLNRFKYLKRLFRKYQETNDLKERLIINHLVTLYNLFGPEPATRMLFLKLSEYKRELKPFLVLLGVMPEVVENIGLTNENVISSSITMDPHIVEVLRKI
jgi:hypothetical protein